MHKPLYMALPKEGNYGWGVCSRYLQQESKALGFDFRLADEHTPTIVDGIVLQALTDLEMNPMVPVRGHKNFGYTFFENELTQKSIENLKTYDFVWAGSTWCRDKLVASGIDRAGVLLQGIDPSRFFPLPAKVDATQFTIFSGGKFELRKGQDLVLVAFRELQKKYPEIALINCWFNLWPDTIRLFKFSKYMVLGTGNSWSEFMNDIYARNDVDATNVKTCELVDNHNLRDLFATTDIGLFPNRCEGGTNLVMMEYMACGKPVLGSWTSGHRDILTPNNSLLLDDLQPFQIFDQQGQLWTDWEEPKVHQLIERIEYAYHHRDVLHQLGQRAGEDMRRLTWQQTAKSLISMIHDRL
jgi:glycosyltransferase involved in cell wall biosynthesis